MSRYFFNFTDGTQSLNDTTGTELPDLEAAKAYAIVEIRKLLMRHNGAEVWAGWAISIADENGAQLALVHVDDVDGTR